MATNSTQNEALIALKRKQELANELNNLKKQKIVSSKYAEKLNNLLIDKNIRKQNDFSQAGAKQFGVSAGYIAKEKDTNNTFILKQFYKNNINANSKQDRDNRRDGAQEFLASGLYSLLLYDRAPKEELVIPDKANKDSLNVRSKFFQKVISLDKFSGAPNTNFNPNNPSVIKIEGFEKVVAACNILGELDYHAGNLMVQEQNAEKGQTKYLATTIDHGRSFLEFNKDLGSLTNNLHKNFKLFKYMPNGKVENLKFDITKYASAMEQMTKQLTDPQINNIIDQKIAELKKSGFDPMGLTTYNSSGQLIGINNYQQLSDHYKNEIKTNLQNMKEISKDLNVISKYSNVTQEFKQGGWVKQFAEAKEKDPVIFAVNHNLEIENKDPLIWAIENNHQIRTSLTKADKQEISIERSWEKHGKTWQAVDKLVKSNPIKNITIDPVEYLISKNQGKKFNDLPTSLRSFLFEEVYQANKPEYNKYELSVEKNKIDIPFEKNHIPSPKINKPQQQKTNIIPKIKENLRDINDISYAQQQNKIHPPIQIQKHVVPETNKPQVIKIDPNMLNKPEIKQAMAAFQNLVNKPLPIEIKNKKKSVTQKIKHKFSKIKSKMQKALGR